MSDDYEVVGYILKKKPDGDGCAGCLGALIVIAILGACIESCVGGKKNSGNATAPTYTEPAPVIVQTGTSPVRVVEQRIRCRNCSGKGFKDIWATCLTCNGDRKVVDQVRTAQSAMQGLANGLAKRRHHRPPRPRTYYMTCPSCNGKGKIPRQERCGQCGGDGYLIRR